MHRRFSLITILALVAALGASLPGKAATDACAPLGNPLVDKALGAHATVGRSFDPRGSGPAMQLAALKDATSAQTCVASVPGNPQIEMRATIATFANAVAAKAARDAGINALKAVIANAGSAAGQSSTGQVTVAGLNAGFLRLEGAIHSYTISATKAATNYSLSAGAGNAIDEGAMKTLFAMLVK